VVSKERDSKIIVNLLVTSVSRCTGCNAMKLGLKHQQLPDIGASGRPPEGANIACVCVCVCVREIERSSATIIFYTEDEWVERGQNQKERNKNELITYINVPISA